MTKSTLNFLPRQDQAVTSLDLEHFKQIIRTRYQLDFKPDFFRFLQDALEARLRVTATATPAEYLHLLENDSEEIAHLVNLLTNKETYFLRESPHYLLLTRELFPNLLRDRPYFGKKVRIVSAGCSSGEEPYSLIIALVETFGEGVTDQIEVTGLDINDEVLHHASMAVFGRYSFRGVAPEIRQRYFSEFAGNRFVLNQMIRENVRFQRHNLAQWPYPEQARHADLIFYRNVSIYYQPDTRSAIFENLSRLLNPGGYLLMGAVEVPLHDTGVLKMNQYENVFYFSKEPQSLKTAPLLHQPPLPVRTQAPAPVPAPEPPTPARAPAIDDGETLLDEARTLAQEEQMEAALDKVENVVRAHPDCCVAIGLKAYILLQLNRNRETEETCRMALQQNDFLPLPHLLLGLAFQKGTNHGEAVKQLRKVIYLDPACWLAHFHLAESYRATGDVKSACSEFNITLKLLEDAGLDNHGLPVFHSSYTADQMVTICRNQIRQLAGT